MLEEKLHNPNLPANHQDAGNEEERDEAFYAEPPEYEPDMELDKEL